MSKLLFFPFLILFSSCNFKNEMIPFKFEKDKQGIELLENGKPIFFYQKTPKSLTGKYITNNYLHPLYSLDGDTLTEEFPVDHPHHRGIFWAWHQIYINGKKVGDGWAMENIEQEVVDIRTITKENFAEMKLMVLWKSPLFESSKPFINEQTTIKVHPLQNEVRKIDFAIALKALVPGVEIGGSNDIKGYGGLSARLKLPADLKFTSSKGPVTPRTEQIKAGPWMDFSSSFTGTGLSILCHPETPNYPAPWILRSEESMQNIVFPGKERITLAMDKPVLLYYRLIIYNGTNGININKLQSEYEEKTVVN